MKNTINKPIAKILHRHFSIIFKKRTINRIGIEIIRESFTHIPIKQTKTIHNRLSQEKPRRTNLTTPQRKNEKTNTAATSLFTDVIRSTKEGRRDTNNGIKIRSGFSLLVISTATFHVMKTTMIYRRRDNILAA